MKNIVKKVAAVVVVIGMLGISGAAMASPHGWKHGRDYRYEQHRYEGCRGGWYQVPKPHRTPHQMRHGYRR